MIGLDHRLGHAVKLGLAFSYGHTDVDPSASSPASTSVDSYQLFVYGRYQAGPLYADGIFGAGWNDYDTDRSVLGSQAQASFSGQSCTALAEGTGSRSIR